MNVVLERLEVTADNEEEWVYWGMYNTANKSELDSLIEAAAMLGQNHKVRVREVK